MNKHYLFLCALFTYAFTFSQTECADADSNLIYAYSNVKSAYKANNISHLKHYAHKSLQSFEKAKINLTKCGCTKAFDLSYKAAELLAKVEPAKTYEDGRFFVKRAREIAKESITELNKCSISTDEPLNIETENTNDDLIDLQKEQAKLEQQKLELKKKEVAIKEKLANQKNKENYLIKVALIKKYKTALNSNIKSFNAILKIYGSDTKIPLDIEGDTNLTSKSIEGIKVYYLNSTKNMTALYLEKLNAL